LAGEFFSSFSALKGVAAGPFDVLADDGGEFGSGGFGFGEQVGQASVSGDARVGEGQVRVSPAALLQVDGAGLDVPVHGRDEPPGRSQSQTERIWRRMEARGSWSSTVEVRAVVVS